MIPLKNTGLIWAAVLGLSACGMTTLDKYAEGLPMENIPHKTGSTPAAYEKDRLDCEVLAANTVPQSLSVSTTPSYTTTAYTSCYGYSCTTTGGDTIGGNLVTRDNNTGLRNRFYAQCLAQKGWSFINIKACPQGTEWSDFVDRIQGYERPNATYCYIPGEGESFYSGNLQ